MNREEAKRLDDESLARVLEWQIRNRPPRERVEVFGRRVLRLTAEAMQAGQIDNLGEQLLEWLEVQEPEDIATCERLLTELDPARPMDEDIFQAAVNRATEADGHE